MSDVPEDRWARRLTRVQNWVSNAERKHFDLFRRVMAMDSASRLPGRAVFVLGAGSSRDAGYPLVRDMLDTEYIRSILHPLKGSYYDGGREAWEAILTGECQYFKTWNLPVEELFKKFADERDHQNLERLRNYLAQLLYIAREKSISHQNGADRLLFARLLLRYQHAAVISFNYDLLIDMGIKELEMIAARAYGEETGLLTYGFPPGETTHPEIRKNTVHLMPTGQVPPPYTGVIPLLKLHGSLNWGKCASCGRVTIHSTEVLERGGHNGEPHGCAWCRANDVEPLILPPSRDKVIDELSALWGQAGTLLDAADTVVFVGYSLPPYDIEALRLFRSTCSQVALRPKRIFVVDPFISDAMRERYEDLNPSVEFVDEGFRKFLSTTSPDAP